MTSYLDVTVMESRSQSDYRTSFTNCDHLKIDNIQVWNFIPGQIGHGKWYDIKDYVAGDFEILNNKTLVRVHIEDIEL